MTDSCSLVVGNLENTVWFQIEITLAIVRSQWRDNLILEYEKTYRGMIWSKHMNTGLYNETNNIQLKKLFYQTISPGDPTILSTSLGDPYLSLYYSDLLTKTITGSVNNLYDSALLI